MSVTLKTEKKEKVTQLSLNFRVQVDSPVTLVLLESLVQLYVRR